MSKPGRTRRAAKGGASKCSSTKATWLMVGCAFVAVGIITVMPKVGGAGHNFMYPNQEPDVSTTFSGVRVPSETVPVALGRTIGSRNDETPLDLQVFLCNLDRNTYFHKPYKYPMFKDLVRLSGGCTGQFSTATSLSQLQSEIDANPDNYLEPTGFVFHMSRCGSTLAANLMGSSPYNLVYSESKPPAQLMSVCDTVGCSQDQRVQALRTIIRAMGKTSFHKHMFFKFQSSNSKLIDYFRMAFPDTPWIFVYREPVPVLMSLLGFKDGKMGATSSGSPCLRTKNNPSQKTANFLSMTKAEAKGASSEDYCAAHLATLMDAALSSLSAAGVEDGARGVAVDYETLPEAIVPIMADVFGAPLTPAEEYYAKEISGWYSKSRTGVHSFTPDTKAKEERATPKVTEAAKRIMLPFYDRLGEVSLPKESIPAELAIGYTPDNSRRELSDEEFEATPVHMRGLDRVVDPLAPEWMASSVWKSMPIEPFECPDEPPENYPKGFPAMDVINHWNPDVTDQVPDTHYLSTCRFDYHRELAKAERYRQAEKPFILYNIPSVDATAGRWSDPDYMEKILGPYTKYATEHSVNNHFMYFNHKVAKDAKRGYDHGLNLTDWKPPTDSVNLSYRQWLELAKTHGKGGGEHWYFRVGDANNKVILKEMPIFQKPAGGGGNIFLVEPRGQRGIHCRFGMPGVIAEAHFDGSRNMVAMISGVRRWIMSHPNQCESMYLLPHGHPSGRHSDVDWSNPDLEKFPEFPRTLISEVLLKAGEVLYVPTHWFHYISNIGINAQCNSRSGVAYNYDEDLDKCGFGTSHPHPQSKKSQYKPHFL